MGVLFQNKGIFGDEMMYSCLLFRVSNITAGLEVAEFERDFLVREIYYWNEVHKGYLNKIYLN